VKEKNFFFEVINIVLLRKLQLKKPGQTKELLKA
jgi:hypothetical protein